ncbi:DUF3987 domain-containing protein (plasmid) [Cyanobacterium sp. IPPAS B-1200]|uniref:DUF3987 domain-containing protein n=1 Tax=Cyanobacterium sp. IPPAS B-1200 TaxID=1562720 RepID=UPI003D398765
MTYDKAFRIGEHLDLFTPTTTKGKYICPICGGDDFSISKDGQKYNCYNSGGECNKEIFKWVGERKGLSIHKAKKEDIKTYSPPKDPIVIATTVDYKSPVTEMIAEYENEASLKKYAMWLNYPGGNKVKRVLTTKRKDGREKREKNFYGYEKGNDKSKITTIWEPYHLELFSQATGKWILDLEGEKACDHALHRGLISTCILGSKATDIDHIIRLCERIKQYQIKGIIYITDNDKEGLDKAIKTREIVASQGIPFIILPITYLYPEVPEHGDFEEYSNHTKLSPEAIKTNIELTVGANLEELLNIDNSIVTVDIREKLDRAIEKPSPIEVTRQSQLLLNRLLGDEFTEDERELQITTFSQEHRVNTNDLRKTLDLMRKRKQDQEYITTIDFDNLINLPKTPLDLYYILGEKIGEEIYTQAKYLYTNPDAIFVALLPAIATLIGNRQKVLVSESTGFKVKPILRVMIVGDSGTGKSNILNASTWALQERDRQLMNTYLHLVDIWFKKPKEERDDDDKPVKLQYVFKNVNFDGLYKNLEINGGTGLILRDELKGYLKMTQSDSGYGDYPAQDLELFEGKPINKERQTSEYCYYIPDPVVNILGTVQWKVLEDVFNHRDDENGTSARWIIWCGELPEYLPPKRDKDKSWFIFLNKLLDAVTSTDIEEELQIDDDAYDYLVNWYTTKIKPLIKQYNAPQIKSKCTKSITEAIKLAQTLHPIQYHFRGSLISSQKGESTKLVEVKSNSIVKEEMIIACHVSEHLLGHFIYGHTITQDSLIEGVVAKILAKIKAKNELTVSECYRSLGGTKQKISRDRIGDIFKQLIDLGLVKQIDSHKGLKVKINTDKD